MAEVESAIFDPEQPAYGTRMTIAEWAALPEDVEGEWKDGVLVEAEVPSVRHELLVVWLIRRLGPWCDQSAALMVASGVGYAIERRNSGRMPDASIFFAGRKPPQSGLVPIPPDIAVEIQSPGAANAERDRVEKVDEYAAFGIRYYWLIDPELRTFEILELGADGRYVVALSASRGMLTKIPGCEGLTIDLDSLWTALDRFVAESS